MSWETLRPGAASGQAVVSALPKLKDPGCPHTKAALVLPGSWAAFHRWKGSCLPAGTATRPLPCIICDTARSAWVLAAQRWKDLVLPLYSTALNIEIDSHLIVPVSGVMTPSRAEAQGVLLCTGSMPSVPRPWTLKVPSSVCPGPLPSQASRRPHTTLAPRHHQTLHLLPIERRSLSL